MRIGRVSLLSVAVVIALAVPAGAVELSAPSLSPGSYTVSWSSSGGKVQLQERAAGATFQTVYDGYATSRSFTKASDGAWEYRARSCIPPEPGFAGYCLPWGSIRRVEVEHPPTTPAWISSSRTDTDGSYGVSWGASTGNNISYELWEARGFAKWSRVYVGTSRTAWFAAKPDGSYAYRARACNRGGCSAFTGSSTFTVLKIPTAPTNVAVPASSSSGAFAVTWHPAWETVGYYVVERRPVGGTFSLVATTVSSWLDVVGNPDGEFELRVRACNASGCGPWATSPPIDVLKIPTVPVLSVDATTTSGRYRVAWSASFETVDHYELQVQEDGGAWQSQTLTATSIDERRVTSGVVGYRVRACNAAGCSAFSTASINVDLRFPDMVADAPIQPVFVPPHQRVGAVEGKAGVEGGSATYTIPIEVPPGRAGMQPAVSLQYTSRSGSGIAGVGWTLSAASVIHRCPRTLAQDGEARAVSFDVDDALCLDGVRLILVDGAHGQSGAEYRTELESFARIRLHGGLQSASSYFVVEHKNGRISYFGAIGGTNAVFVPPGAPAPLSWKLRRTEDRQVNSIEYEYAPNSAGHALLAIRYTGKGATPGTRRVSFSYEGTRPDVLRHYLRGAEITTAWRLAHIRTYVESDHVATYELRYRTSGATGASLLDGVRVCSSESCSDAAALPWTSFEYDEHEIEFAAPQLVPGAADETHASYVLNDYDGDGTRDLLLLEYPEPWGGGPPIRRELRLSSVAAPIDLSDQPWSEAFDAPLDGYPSNRDSDLDRDGRADLVGEVNGAFAIGSWDGSGIAVKTSDLQLGSARIVDLADFDGDGDIDVLAQAGQALSVQINCSDPRGPALAFCGARAVGSLATHERVVSVSDVDGDGMADLYVDWNGDGSATVARILFARTDGGSLSFVSSTIAALGGPSGSLANAPGTGMFDANGDGLIDIYSAAGAVWINHGGQFVAPALTGAEVFVHSHYRDAVFTLDTDGDGVEEMFVPAELVHEYCYTDFEQTDPKTWCGDAFRFTGAPYHLDRSIYRWDAVKFVPRSDGSWERVRRPTALRLPLRSSGARLVYGDGLAHLGYRITSTWVESQHGTIRAGDFKPLLTRGDYVLRNLGADGAGARADRLSSVRDGLGRVVTWEYAPLSSAGVPSCAASAAGPFYRANATPPTPGLYHFTSTMSVVARFIEPDGVGGASATCYRYEDAMYADDGRGFLGFRAITVEQADPDHPAENLRTRTEYHDLFPLTGKVKRVTERRVQDAPSVLPLREVQTTWEPSCDGTICWPHVVEEHSSTRDLHTRELIGQKVTTRSYDPVDLAYGNVSQVTTIVDDPVLTWSERLVYDYDYSSASAWWLDKLRFETRTVEPVVYKIAPTPPPELDPERTVTKVITWYGDGTPSARRVQQQTVVSALVAPWTSTTYAYDTYGNVTTETTSASHLDQARTVSRTYTPDGYFVATLQNPAGHVSSLSFEPTRGQLVAETVYGLTTTFTYDDFGRLTRRDAPGVPAVFQSWQWCDDACVARAAYRIVTVQAGAPTVTEELDVFGRRVRRSHSGFDGAADVVAVVEYDDRGRQIRVAQPSTDPEGAYFTEYTDYDALGRPGRRTVDRSGHAVASVTTVYEYDGLTTIARLPGGVTTSRTHDSVGRLVTTVDAAGSVTSYRHDAAGNVVLAEDPSGNRIQARFDDFGRRVALSDPDRGEWRFEYDGLGQLLASEDANGVRVEQDYDVLGRLRAQRIDGVVDAEWSYDSSGPGLLDWERRIGAVRREFVYDALRRPVRTTTEIDGREFVKEVGYDSAYGWVKAIRYPSGDVVRFERDAAGSSKRELDPLAEGGDFVYRVVLARSPRGDVTSARYGNGLVGAYSYVASTGDLREIVVGAEGGPPVQHLGYAYEDAYGNLTRRSNEVLGASEAFAYDTLQRLTASTRSGPWGTAAIGYAYDDLGNLIRKDDYATAYLYGDAGRQQGGNAGPHAVRSIQRSDGTIVDDFVYDGNGNMVAGDGRSISYDAFNLPIEVVEGGAVTTYRYGPGGERVVQGSGARTTYYVDDDYELVVEGGAEIQRVYVAGYLLIEHADGARRVRYLHPDRLGSTDTITDEAGDVVERHGFDAFGKALTSTWQDTGGSLHSGEFAEASTSRGFTGHEHLDAHRLVHMRGRMFDPRLGRFLSADPLIQNPANSQSFNPYSYVLNNPLSGTDPTGYACDPAPGDSAQCTDSEGYVVEGGPEPAGANGAETQGVQPERSAPSAEKAEAKTYLVSSECTDASCSTVRNVYIDENGNQTEQYADAEVIEMRGSAGDIEEVNDTSFARSGGGFYIGPREQDFYEVDEWTYWTRYRSAQANERFDGEIRDRVLGVLDTIETVGSVAMELEMMFAPGGGLAAYDGVTSLPPALSRGSTANLAKGTTLPRNLREELAVEQARSAPAAGTRLPLKMTDPRWPASEGWAKMQLVIKPGGDPINVHYVFNQATGAIDDFKIVVPGRRPQ